MNIIKRLFYFVLVVVFFAAAAFAIWLFVPFTISEYVRVSEMPRQIRAQYIDIQGDPLCTKLYLIDESGQVGHGIFPRVANDIPDPNKMPSLQNGDQITLEGYFYEWKKTNKITGNIITKPVYQIDVISWSDSYANHYKSAERNPDKFSAENYTDCHP